MFDRSKLRYIILPTVAIAAVQTFADSTFAHNVKTDADVGATFHIEPDHNPRAGETAQAWFALTRQGGDRIPLAQCDCQLAVYDRTTSETEPILTPPLQAISAEQYRDIPGADIIFPQAGAYELEISGSAKDGESFAPFSLTYSVTVIPGTAPAESTAELTTESPIESAATNATSTEMATSAPVSPTASSWLVPAIVTGSLLVAGAFLFVKQLTKSKES